MMPECSLDDLKQTGPNEFRQVPTGTFAVNRKGRMVPVTKGEEYVVTRLGKIPEDEWCRLAEDAIEKEGKADLYAAIRSHCKAHCAWLRTEEALRRWALSCLVSEAYTHWDDFTGDKQ